MSNTDVCGVAPSWVLDATESDYTVHYRENLRKQVHRYVDQADRHTLKLIQKFIKSLER